MLKFSRKPDKIFTEILGSSFTFVLDIIADCSEDNFECLLPYASRNLSKEAAIGVLRELIKYNKASGLWELNDYHYVLIYDVLKVFCNAMKEIAKDSTEPILALNKCKIWEIDFEALVAVYFPDTDFLMSPDLIVNLPAEVKQKLAIRKETFGVAMGMRVHPEELKVKLHEEGDFIPANPSPVYFRKVSKKYPDYYTGKY